MSRVMGRQGGRTDRRGDRESRVGTANLYWPKTVATVHGVAGLRGFTAVVLGETASVLPACSRGFCYWAWEKQAHVSLHVHSCRPKGAACPMWQRFSDRLPARYVPLASAVCPTGRHAQGRNRRSGSGRRISAITASRSPRRMPVAGESTSIRRWSTSRNRSRLSPTANTVFKGNGRTRHEDDARTGP